MTPSLPLVDGDTLFIDNSTLETFTTCARQAMYFAGLKRQGNGERVALKFGGIAHKVLEARYRAATSMYAQSPEVERVMVATAEKEYATWQPPMDDFRNYSCMIELIQRYGLEYPFENFDIVKTPAGVPMVEVPFALKLGTLTIDADLPVRQSDGQISVRHVGTINLVWTGKIDIGAQLDNRLYIWDHKTTSVMGPSYFKEFDLSHAMIGYSWATEQILGRPVYGYVINAIGVRKPTKTGKAFEFVRQTYVLDRWKVDEWVTDTLHLVADFVENIRRGYAPKCTKWCFGKYGECQFFRVCSLPPEQREFMLYQTTEFGDVTWSPLHGE